MKGLTLTQIRSLKKETSNKLERYVYDYIMDEWYNYDDKKSIFTDVLYYGCQSGIVSDLIYYSDTTKFYSIYQVEINELLYNTLWSCGCKSPSELFSEKWDDEDPLAIDVSNQNLLAWFGFEETMRNIAYKLDLDI